jgi:multidrug resistance efflux pump
MKKILVLAMVVGLAAGTGGRLILRGHAASDPGESPSSVPPVDLVAANGTVEPCRPEVAIRPEVTGVLTALHVRENATVVRGQVLGELSNESQKAHVRLAQAELAVAREQLRKLRSGERTQVIARARAEEKARVATLQQAQDDWDRAKTLPTGLSRADLEGYRTRLSLAQAELEKARADLRLLEEGSREEDIAAAVAQVEVAQAKLHVAEADLAKTRLTAPSNGTVMQVFAEPGELASPTSAQPVLIVADMTRRRVRAFVEELDVARVAVGQTATVAADGLPGCTFAGRVAVVLPRMGKRAPQSDAPNELKDLYYREVLIDLDAGDQLPTNLRVQVQIRADGVSSKPAL